MPINLRVENIVPSLKRTNAVPVLRASSFQTGIRPITTGGPIGLLLVLTYAEDVTRGLYSDYRPNMRITNA